MWHVYEVLVHWLACYGYAPTVRQLQALCGYSSTSTVKWHLDKLRARGLVTWKRGSARTLRVMRGG